MFILVNIKLDIKMNSVQGAQQTFYTILCHKISKEMRLGTKTGNSHLQYSKSHVGKPSVCTVQCRSMSKKKTKPDRI